MPTGSLEDRVALLERTLNARLRLQAELQQQVDSPAGEVSSCAVSWNSRPTRWNSRKSVSVSSIRSSTRWPTASLLLPSSPGSRRCECDTGSCGQLLTNLNENQAYDAAVNMVLKEKNYDKAIPAFEGFIKQYPSSSYVPNAHYWLGQLLFNKGDRTGAAAQFTTVATKFSKSPKRADALLLGMLAQLDGKKAEAKNFYEQVIKGYPNTSPAQLAKQSLSKL